MVSGRDNFEIDIRKKIWRSEEEEDVHQFHWPGTSHVKYNAAEEKLPWVRLSGTYECAQSRGERQECGTELSRR